MRVEQRLEFRLFFGEFLEVGVGLAVGGVDFVQTLTRRDEFSQPFLDGFAHGFFGIEFGFLLEKADREVGSGRCLAFDLGVHARHDAQDGRLARAVEAEDADLRPRQETERDILEDLALGRDRLAHAIHGIHVLSHAPK